MQVMSGRPRTPAIMAALGLVLAGVCFAVSAAMHPNDMVSAGWQGFVFVCGVVHLVIAPLGFLFPRTSSPPTGATPILWILWSVLAVPVYSIGLLVTFAAVGTLLGR